MHYIVGDIQGCFDELMALLGRVRFDPAKDKLIAVGDLVARGPKSLEVMTYFMSLGDAACTVLGNHDLHLLAVLCGLKKAKKNDKLQGLLDSDRVADIVHYLRQQPLALWLDEAKVLVTHAGLPPGWNKDDCLAASNEISQALKSPGWQGMLAAMYGNEPDRWDPALGDDQRRRYIINALTRMRFCYPDGRLELAHKETPADGEQDGLIPWYQFHSPLPFTLAFGHWAALNGELARPDIRALDTGCVWGNKLSLWCVETDQRHTQAAYS